MEKVDIVDGVAANMAAPNINTDAIIPAAFMRSINSDYGGSLFARTRFDLEGGENPDFILNQEPFRQSKIIVGSVNFGCGSSREAAVWALYGFGIRCVIAESFGDIFYENSFKNGLLLITLSTAELDEIRGHLEAVNDPTLKVDLRACVITAAGGLEIPFTVPEARRHALLEGLDEIGRTLKLDQEIAAFQTNLKIDQPWVFTRHAPAAA